MPQNDFVYIVMNKPAGCVCSYVSDSHKTVYQLLSPELQELMKNKRGRRLHTVGRLDCDTSGLLFFTTDGIFSNKLTRPESHIEKTYEAVLKFPVPENNDLASDENSFLTEEKEFIPDLCKKMLTQNDYINLFKSGLILPAEKKFPEQKAAPAQIEFIEENRCLVTIKEGKFHQVRRMFQAIQNEVLELKRLKIGSYELPENLAPGEYVERDELKVFA